MPTVFNAANELAVRNYLEVKDTVFWIFMRLLHSLWKDIKKSTHPDLDEILSVEQDTYQWIESRW